MGTQDNNRYRAYVDEVGDDLKSTLMAGLKFINWDRYIDRNTRVFVKPNFTFPYYKEGVTTSPRFLGCLLEILKSRAGTVTVGESDGGNHSFKAEAAFEGHDMYRICREAGVELVNLSTLPSETVEAEIVSQKVRVQLPRMLLEDVDCFISVPVLKIHVITTVSLSLKNSWGCVPDTMRGLHHRHLAHKLALVAKYLKPKIVAVDGTYALNRHGPMYGEAIRTNLVVMANNSVVADALGASIMGFLPQRVGHIALAARAGLGSLDLGDSVVINQNWEKYRRQFRIEKTLVDRISALLFHSDALARLVMASPLTPAIYTVAGLLRSSQEKDLASQLGEHKTLGPY